MTVSATTRDRRPGRAGRARVLVPRPGGVPRPGSRPASSSSTSTYVSGPSLRHAALGARPDPRERPRAAARARDRGREARSRARMPGAVTIFISAAVDELERRLRERDDRERRARSASASPSRGSQLERRTLRLHRRERRPRAGGRGADAAGPRPAGTCRYHVAAMIHPRVDDLLQNVDSRYALVIVAREAGPADQQLPPPARRGHLRRQSAAARGVALEELPHDGDGGESPRACLTYDYVVSARAP